MGRAKKRCIEEVAPEEPEDLIPKEEPEPEPEVTEEEDLRSFLVQRFTDGGMEAKDVAYAMDRYADICATQLTIAKRDRSNARDHEKMHMQVEGLKDFLCGKGQ
jgi:hypothetical protein